MPAASGNARRRLLRPVERPQNPESDHRRPFSRQSDGFPPGLAHPPPPLQRPYPPGARPFGLDGAANSVRYPLHAFGVLPPLTKPWPARVWSVLRFAGSGQPRSRLGEGWGGGDAIDRGLAISNDPLWGGQMRHRRKGAPSVAYVMGGAEGSAPSSRQQRRHRHAPPTPPSQRRAPARPDLALASCGECAFLP